MNSRSKYHPKVELPPRLRRGDAVAPLGCPACMGQWDRAHLRAQCEAGEVTGRQPIGTTGNALAVTSADDINAPASNGLDQPQGHWKP